MTRDRAMAAEQAHGAPPRRIAVTIPILTNIVRAIAGEDFQLTTILHGTADPHSFEPTPKDAFRVAGSELLFGIGGHFDEWAVRLFGAGSAKAKCPAVFFLNQLSESERREYLLLSSDAEDEHHHADEGFDPHIWLDPILVRELLVPRITTAFSACYGEASEFEARAKSFSAELTTLDQALRAQLSNLNSRKFLAIHSSWTYYCRRYGLTCIGELESSPAKRASMRRMVALVELARSKNVELVVADNAIDAITANKVAAELSGRVAVIDPLGINSLESRASYADVLNNITTELRTALGS